MKQFAAITRTLHGLALAASLVATGAMAAEPADTVDMGEAIPTVADVREGLFPDECSADCKALREAGFKVMGFKPPKVFSLPATSFKVGSADLPDLLRRQLDVFAEALRGKKPSGRLVRVEGHADASGSADVNKSLSQRRADAVKSYLVDKGTDAGLLEAVGMGSMAPKVSDPYAAVNRRVEIGSLLVKP